MNYINKDNLFHVHTYRCGHSDIHEENAIKAAVGKGFKTITFTDHAPFPQNPFGNRMKYEELDDYVLSLRKLRDKYEAEINIVIGLEAEYFNSFDRQGYYDALKEKGIELLILGQHMAELSDGTYTFSMKDRALEYPYLAEAVICGLNTGYFDILAHPDRVFIRSGREWTDDKTVLSDKMTDAAVANNAMLEYNISSPIPEFWEIVDSHNDVNNIKIIKGYDLHHMAELDSI